MTSVAGAYHDTGYANGYIGSSIYTGPTQGGNVPAGHKTSVFTTDGTLLYSYPTTTTNGPAVRPGDEFNTGWTPYTLLPIYNGAGPSGFGTTVFDTWVRRRLYDQTVTDDPFATAAELGLMEGFPPPADKRVDRSNALVVPPYNRWSYLHMRTVFPSAPVPNGDTVRPIEVQLDDSITDLTIRRADGSATRMSNYLRETYTDSFLVVRPSHIAYESYSNGMHARQPHQMMSVTKSFAGLFALMAIAERRIDEQQSITDIVPELSTASAFADATVGHVLDMVNSMAFNEDYADPTSGIVRYGQVLGWLPAPPDPNTSSLYSFLATLQKDARHSHGDIFRYQTPKTDVVNWITNRSTGKSFQQLMSDALWAPLGTEAEAYVLLDQGGTLVAGGGLNAAPRDLARLAMMLLNDGRVGADQVIAPSIIDTLARGGDRDAFSRGPEAVAYMSNGDWSYRAQWWVRHTPSREAFTAIGIHGQWVYVDRRHGIAFVRQSSQPVSSDPVADEFTLNAFDAITDHLA